MKLSAKLLTTFFSLLSLVGASLLWLTRVVDLKSQSLYFDQPNKVWYIFMHIGIMGTFWIMNASFKRPIYGMVAFASLLTLGFDLGGFEMLHNISTAILFILACASIIIYNEYKKFDIGLCIIAAIAFLSGLFGWLGSSGIFLGEFIAEICLSIALLTQIWKI